MKKILKKSCMSLTLVVLLASCKKFDQINVDPTAASATQVQVEYFIDNSIIQAQMNPGVSERAFILYWQAAGHQVGDADGATFSVAAYNDEWIGEYYNNQSGALNYINSAIDVATQQITDKTAKAYTNNLLQVSRIWRAYLLSEMSDCFGPMPIAGFQGTNPNFVDVKSVYYYMLDELKDAASKIDVTVSGSSISKEDPAYGFNFTKWLKYGNSLRLRLAMRLSEVDPSEAQSQFEDAAKGLLMTDNADIFQIQEKPGWDNLSGVYTRCWYLLPLGVSLNNVIVNLGGVKSQDQLASIITDPGQLAAADANIKPADYVGQYFPYQFSTMTNNPVTGYWLDGLPNTIDPRAYQMFYIPGNTNSPTFPNGTCGAISNVTTGAQLRDANNNVVKTIDATWTWNPAPDGNWGAKGGQIDAKNDLINIGNTNGFVPSLQQDFRAQTAKRVFFAPWETYFLLAEGAVRGWASPVDAQTAYQNGVQSSFSYWNVPIGNYLTSDDYNRDGTSVDWNNTSEPGANHMMSYVDGITGTPGTTSINYPVNNLYMSGAVRNDHLTKIITQKFIAQTPWLPLEAWNDHRRLGLPFWENVILESPIQTIPALTSSNYMTSSQQFFPQRMKYPSGLQNSNVTGYNQAISALGGSDNVLTSLWWAQH
jgi:hypothetical protein